MAGSLENSTWWPTHRKELLVGLSRAGIMLVLLFMVVMSWFFGSAFEQRYRVHSLNVLVVDYDGAGIGSSVSAAYRTAFASDEFPTFEFASAAQYPDPASVRHAVCKQGYWGAMYTHEGATSRLSAAVTGNATSAYDASDAITYIYSETRYPATSDSFIKANLASLAAASRSFFYQTSDGRSALAQVNASNSTAMTAFLNPISPTEDNLHPMQQGSRVFINTVNLVMPILSQFFFVLASNGLTAAAGVMTNLPTSRVWLLRYSCGKVFSLLLSLAIAGYMWAFREDWDVHAIHFARTWMILWFYVDINNLIFDSLIGSFIPMQFSPFLVLSWVLLNIASSVFPFELSAGFFRIGYMFPSHETYLLLIHAWTGCFNKDYIALPVMFSWWIVGHVTSVISVRKRCADARRMAAMALTPMPPSSSSEKNSYLDRDDDKMVDGNDDGVLVPRTQGGTLSDDDMTISVGVRDN